MRSTHPRTARRVRLAGLATLSLSAAAVAFAPSQADAQAVSASVADQRRQAGEAFDRGTTAMLANDFRAAAHFFEQAYHLAPAAVALKQAIRAHDQAGNAFRAANLALRLRDNYPNDANGQELSAEILGRYGANYAEVHATCTDCAVLVNDALVADRVNGTVRFFVQPDTTVTVTGQFQYGNVTAETRGAAGQVVEVPAFEAPPAPPPPPDEPDRVVYVEPDGGTPPALFWVAAGLTLGAGGATTYFGLDTLDGVEAYEDAVAAGDRARAQALLDDGEKKETLTNALIGTTAGLGALSIVLAIVTDWDGDEESATTASRRVQGLAATVAPTTGGASVVVGGRF